MKLLSFEKSIGGVIFRRENGTIKFLLLKYRNKHWSFPKGHIEEGESEEETVRREVREETGITDIEIMPDFRLLQKYWYLAKGQEKEKRLKSGNGILVFKKVWYYLAESKTVEISLCPEHIDYVWLENEKALSKITYPGDKRVFGEATEALLAKKDSLGRI